MKNSMIVRSGILVLMFVFHQVSEAQWTQTNGPAAGDVNAMAVMGTTLFAGSTQNGVFVSSDNGAQWRPANAGLLNTTVYSFAVNTAGLFAGTDRGVFSSSDQGTTWTALTSGLGAQSVRALAAAGGGSGVLLAGTETNGVFLSPDNGLHWSAVNNGLTTMNVRALAIGPAQWFAATAGGGVFRSIDQGASWSQASTGLSNLGVNALYLNGSNLYAGTEGGGIFLSQDLGATWSALNAGIAPTVSVRAITSLGATLFAGTVGMGVYRSSDQGQSWTLAQNGLPKINTLCFATIGANLFAGILGGGVFLSTNNADSWTPVNNGMTTSVVLALAANGGTVFAGLFRNHCYTSSDQGAHWTINSTGLASVSVMALARSGSTIYAGSDGGAFYTTTNGASWVAINTGLSPLYVSALAVRGTALFAGTSLGVSVSLNGGSSWMQAGGGLPADTYIYSMLATDNSVFAGTAGSGLYRSMDNGASWSAVNAGLPSSCYVQALAQSGSMLFAGTNAGVYRSSDNGATWSEMNNGLTNTFIHAIALNGTTMYAGTEGGVFFSDNNGASWTSVNTGLTNAAVYALAINGSDLYAGTGGSGVLRLGVGPLPTFTISGTTGIAGTTMSWTDTTAKTITADNAGNYSLRVSNSWSGTIRPSSAGYSFSPQSRTYANVRSDLASQNFSPVVMYTITGYAGGSNVTLTWTDDTVHTAVSNSSGAYTISVPAHWSGTVTPSRPGYLFYPDVSSYSNVSSNITSQGYSMWRGVLIAGNAGAPGVTMTWSDGGTKRVVSDSSGNYALTVSYSYWGTITPSLAGCSFTPASRYYSGQRSDVTSDNYAVTGSVAVNVKVFLAGAFTGSAMTTALAAAGVLPLNSEAAYASSLYGYTSRSVTAIPPTGIVDWVLVELRRGTSLASRAGVQAGFVRSDGAITDLDGASQLTFPNVAPGSYYIVVYHRNHCAVMSSSRVPLSTPSAPYDFTAAMARAYGLNAMDVLPGGCYGMVGGDVNRDGAVTGSDYNIFSQRYAAIAGGYDDADMNLDALVTGSDFNIFSPSYIAIRCTQVPK